MSSAKRKVVHFGTDNTRAACTAWLGLKAKKTQSWPEVTCPRCKLKEPVPQDY